VKSELWIEPKKMFFNVLIGLLKNLCQADMVGSLMDAAARKQALGKLCFQVSSNDCWRTG